MRESFALPLFRAFSKPAQWKVAGFDAGSIAFKDPQPFVHDISRTAHPPPFLDAASHLHFVSTSVVSVARSHFPYPKCRPRPRCPLSPLSQTWVLYKRQIVARIRTLKRTHAYKFRSQIFHVWYVLAKTGLAAGSPAWLPEFDAQYPYWVLAYSAKVLRQAKQCTTFMIAQDRSAAIEQHLVDVDGMFLAGDSHSFFKYARLPKQAAAGTFAIEDSSGTHHSTYSEVKSAFFVHFQAKLQAVASSVFQIVAGSRPGMFPPSHFASSMGALSDFPLFPVDRDLLQSDIASASNLMASGPSADPNRLYKLHPSISTDAIMPICDKVSFGDVPIQVAGSIIHPLHQGKPGAKGFSAYRDVSLYDSVCKFVLKQYRRSIVPSLQSDALHSMYGGVQKRGTDLAVHHIHTKIAIAKASLQMLGIIFLDVRDAFISMQRFLVVQFGDRPVSDDFVRHLFSTMSLGADAYLEFCAICAGDTATAQAAASADQISMLSGYLATSWYAMQGDSRAGVHCKGASAGGTLSDVIFLFAIARLLRYVYRVCE